MNIMLTRCYLYLLSVFRYFLHYSGHGGQVEDLDGDETGGFDNCIYPLDHAKSGVITDDVIKTDFLCCAYVGAC